MATLTTTITVPDNKATDILNTVTAYLGYSADLGLTKKQFLDQQIKNYIKGCYESGKVDVQVSTARQTALTDAQSVEMTA